MNQKRYYNQKMNVLNLTINNGEMLNDNTLTKTIDADDKNLDKKN